MKLRALFLFFALIAKTPALPPSTSEHRWQLVRDGEGRLKVVDSVDTFDADLEPAFVPEQDVFFLLFTRDNPTVGQNITWTRASIDSSNFRAGGPTRFLIHGWTASYASTENPITTAEFLALGDFNVVVVDWSVGAQTANYIVARNRVGPAGAVVARLIDFLHANGYATFAGINVVGHSLGSHVAGHVGKSVQRGRINAIFGTDPAGPLFTVDNPDRLDAEDADYTEAIHTNAGTQGFDLPITHAAFYPNWGRSQPGCGLDLTGACAHARAPLLYAESLNRPLLVARQCASFEEVSQQNCPGTGVSAVLGGDAAKPTVRGVFFLTTNGESPFGQG